jgi:hypothetical protein
MTKRLSNGRCAAFWLVLLPVSWAIADGIEMTQAAAKVGCEIRATRNDAAGKLDAVISATGPVSGSFVFKVQKRAGGAVTSQSGDFKIDTASPSEVKKASIDLEPGQAYDASLTIKWPGGSSSCSASVS